MINMPSLEEIMASMSVMSAPVPMAGRTKAAPMDINNWPSHLMSLSMETQMIEIEREDLPELFDHNEEILAKYVDLVNNLVNGVEHFVKLNSRSPKDASYPAAPIIYSGEEAIELIVNSMRCMDDAFEMYTAEHRCYIVLRKVVPMTIERELRCYAKNGELVGAARYNYHESADETFWNDSIAAQLLQEAEAFYENHLKADYADVVFDLALDLGNHANVPSEKHLLIEINPYGLSDPCLFKSYENLEQTRGIAW